MKIKFTKREQEEALFAKSLVNAIKTAVFCLEANARFIYANNATCCLLEFSREELLGMTLEDVAIGFAPETWIKQWQTVVQQGFFSFPCQCRTKNGRILTVEIAISHVRESEQEFGCAYMCLSDIQSAPSNESKTELANPLSILRSTFDSAACGIISVSFEGKAIDCNQKFLEMWQIPSSMTLSSDPATCQTFFANKLKNPDVFHRSVWEVPRDSVAETYDILELTDERIFIQYSKPQRLGDRVIGRVWSIWDITDFKQHAEAQLSQIQEFLEYYRPLEQEQYVSELKARFFATICHQFRSFLNIISFSNSLLRRCVEQGVEKKLPYINNIQTAVEEIGKLLDGLIFIGQSEVGKINFNPKPTDVERSCRDLIAQIESLGDGKQQPIEFTSQGNCSSVCIDWDLIQHMLMNLLSNSVKYTTDGSKIEFKLVRRPEKLIFQIKDKGIGIPKSDRQRIFEPFYRGSNVNNIPGNGLGLAIVNNIINIHDGQIVVDSKEGVGTIFTVTIPALQ
jgi:PAS domain S-box-containing protein